MKLNPFNGWRRTLQDATGDYNRLCLQLGHLEHSKHAIDRQIRLIHQQMEGVGKEAQRLAKKAPAPAKKPEGKPPPEGPAKAA